MPPKNSRSGRFPRVVISVFTVAVLIGAWQLYVSFAHIAPTVLASPWAVATSIGHTWRPLLAATGPTAFEGMVGFAASIIVGIPIGIGLFVWRGFRAAASPLLWIAQTLPLITVAPLFVIWFGFESTGKIILVAIFSIFPIAVQTFRGLSSVDTFYTDVALTCGSTRGWALWHVQLVVASPHIFSGLRISAAYVFATAATAEFLGARGGLGIFLQSAFNSFQTPLIFAATLAIVVLTGLLLGVVALVGRVMVPRDV